MEHRRPALYGAAIFSLFIVYGSLYPFDWVARPGATLWGDLMSLFFAESVESSRVDFATNMLLSVPVAFCLMVYLRARTRLAAPGLALIVLAYVAVLSTAVETLQLSVSGRVASKYDIAAQVMGALVAVAVWLWRGERLWVLAFDWSPFNPRGTRWQKASALYLTGVFAYGLLPLDLTLSPGDLYTKWKTGKIFLLPFHATAASGGVQLYQLLSVVLIWAVAGWLIRRAHALSAMETVGRTVLASATLELLQLFVLSRTTDTTDVVLAAVGGVCACLAGQPAGGVPAPQDSPSFVRVRAGRLSLIVLGWSILTAALAWYPFETRDMAAVWHDGLAPWRAAPLGDYLDSDLLSAATSLLQKVLLFAPWGVLAAWLLPHTRGSRVMARGVLAYALALMVLVELGKLFLQHRSSNPTNLAFEALSMAITYQWVKLLRRPPASPPVPGAEAAPTPLPAAAPAPPSRLTVWIALLQLVLTASALTLLGGIAPLPYNLRALVSGSSGLALFGFALCLFWSVLPWAAWGRLPPAWRRPRHALALVLLQPLLLYTLLRLSVPSKLVFDIVGTPSMDWPWETERALRFLVLNLLLAWGIWSAHRCFDPRKGGPRNLAHATSWLLGTLAIAALWHAVVVESAVTDNLVELMRDGGGLLSTACLFAWWFLLYSSALVCGQVIFQRRPPAHLAGVLGAGVLAYALLDAALEPVLVKYGQMFSAWQFLLSQDRQHYAPAGSLTLRYAAAHVALMLGLLWALLPLLLPSVFSQRPAGTTAPAPTR